MDGPDMAYTTPEVRTGADRARSAAEVADSVVGLLGGTVVNALAFGDVGSATRFAGGLDTSRDAFARTGHAVHTAHTALDERARSVAATGDQLVSETTTMAGGSISDGMRG